MRLEEHEHASAVANGGEVGRELGRMVCVAVEHGDAAGLALRLEPATRAAEAADHARSVGPRDAGELERGECGRCVPPVVLAGNRKRELHRLELLSAHDVRYMRKP